MDITPKTGYLKSIRGEHVKHEVLIGEAIDNAFDAHARNVDIAIDEAQSQIIITDDGAGIPKHKFSALYSLGDHQPLPTTALGRYGIGIKLQAINCADFMRVESVHAGKKYFTEVDWAKVVRSGRWQIQDPQWLPVDARSQSGTVIMLARLRKWRRYTLDALVEQVAARFYPAIADGWSITINGKAVPVLPEPKLVDVREADIALSADRHIKVRAGILTVPGKYNKVNVAYKHRVIMPASNIGCGEYGGGNRLFARVWLSGEWRLSRFKDDITDEAQLIELEDAISGVLTPLLEKCRSEALEARVEAMATKVNEMLPDGLRPARPIRKKDATAVDQKKRKHNAGLVDEDASTDGGPARKRQSQKGTLKIFFEDGADLHGIGWFESGSIVRPHRVVFSKDHPQIKRLLDSRDETIAAEAILREAMMIYDQGRRANDAQYALEFDHFGKRVAELLTLNNEVAVA